MFGDLTNFGQVLSRNAREWPLETGAICVDSGRSLTWGELNERANRLGNALRASGVERGERVALLLENLHHYAEAFYGCAKLGAPTVNINYRLAAEEIAGILGDTSPSALIFSATFGDIAEELASIGALPALPIAVGHADVGAFEYEAFIGRHSGEEPEDREPIDPLHPLTISFSSGTTGIPKGTTWSHRGAMINSLAFGYGFEIRTGVRLMMATPLAAHCGMLVAGGFLGCSLVFANFEPKTTLAAIEQTRTQYLNLVPILISRLCDAQEQEGHDLSSLTDIIYGGSPISRETLIRGVELLGCRFWQIYSQAEACMAGTVLRPEDHLRFHSDAGLRRLSSCGRPMIGVGVKTVDEDGREVARGEVGEIRIRTEGAMLGYWGNPELSARTVRDGWVVTGDIGFRDEDGYLYVVDRKKDMIISGSFNIYSVEVEEALCEHPSVVDAVVFGVPDDDWGEAVHACVILKPGAETTAEELIELCERKLSRAKRPKSVEFVDDFPRNALGKVLKREMRAAHWAGRERVI